MPKARLTVSSRTPAIVAKLSWIIWRRYARMAVPKVTNLEGQIKLSDGDISTAEDEYVRRFEVLMNTGEMLDQ